MYSDVAGGTIKFSKTPRKREVETVVSGESNDRELCEFLPNLPAKFRLPSAAFRLGPPPQITFPFNRYAAFRSLDPNEIYPVYLKAKNTKPL